MCVCKMLVIYFIPLMGGSLVQMNGSWSKKLDLTFPWIKPKYLPVLEALYGPYRYSAFFINVIIYVLYVRTTIARRTYCHCFRIRYVTEIFWVVKYNSLLYKVTLRPPIFFFFNRSMATFWQGAQSLIRYIRWEFT